ncbi:disease resistance protein At4g27190-like [Benincasa hispida]|uniref:disease resistance protein At4g27190-like n=1 Tax=Benincasa hispida TaxID=102211 RepID=UPI00190189D3|nr:disease resistance protein At4g27190-like [Benincasa hispida]
MDILISVVTKVIECTFEPIGRQVGYIFLYNENMKNLEEQTQSLMNARDRVQQEVDQARGNAHKIFDDVSQWLAEVDEITKQLEKDRHTNPSCFNLIERRRLSRRAYETAKKIRGAFETRKLFCGNVGYPVPLQGIQRCDITDYQILESRTLMADQIKDVLADPNVNKIGVYGMGGIGKSMLLHEVKELVKEHKLFDQVITVIVSRTYDVKGIQAQIADKLRFGFDKLETKQGRADLVRTKLEMEKNMLIMLDDLWTPLDLVDIGIPCRSESNKKGCKILMTSRDRDLLKNNMNADQCFQMNSLDEKESWKFFTTIIGDKFEKNRVEGIAKEVVRKCGRLPIALKIIAKALKDKDVRIWKDILKQLENPVSVNKCIRYLS